jgi:hypothetical protein
MLEAIIVPNFLSLELLDAEIPDAEAPDAPNDAPIPPTSLYKTSEQFENARSAVSTNARTVRYFERARLQSLP